MVWAALSQGVDPFSETAIELKFLTEKTAAVLRENVQVLPWQVTTESVSSCGTRKLLVRLEDGLEVETVVIPDLTGSRSTVCVSSQIGCAENCQFCMTGKMGLVRNLTAGEILGQIFFARGTVRNHGLPPLTNVVYMGMGEPLDNPMAVTRSLGLLTHPFAFAMAKSKISVSTVGPSPAAIRRMRGMPSRLAWSVHAAADDVRRLLVPTTVHTMIELRDAFAEVLESRPREHLFVEVVLIQGMNDSPELARALASLLRPLPTRASINLLPYNDTGHPVFRASSSEAVEEFQRVLNEEGFIATIRPARGGEESSACGQLATSAKNERQRKRRPRCLSGNAGFAKATGTGEFSRHRPTSRGISELVQRRSVDLSSFAPLCHILTRLVASDHQPIVAYAARSVRFLVLDDTLRPQAARAGVSSVLAAALIRRQGDTACLREMLGALQTFCYDERTVLAVIDTGATGSVLELLDTKDLELRFLSIATLTNVLAFSDTLLLSHEECINAVHDRMDAVVAEIKRKDAQGLGLAALANGCAHRAQARRAKELGAQELPTMGWSKEGRKKMMGNVEARLNEHGDVEDGKAPSLLPTAMDTILPFGRCVGVALPKALTDDVMRAAEEELLPEEMAYCAGLPKPLQLGFLGGRLAIRRALDGMKGTAAAAASLAILHNQDGAPLLPKGISASISHKRHMAVALVQSGCEGHVGVDIELPAMRRRLDLRRRILTARECDSLGDVAGMTEQEEVLLRFSVKEAVYKAAHPLLHRPLGFKDPLDY
eukprot:g8991.t2